MKRLLVLAGTGLALLGLAYGLWFYLTVDNCLDAGGRWNHENGLCEGART